MQLATLLVSITLTLLVLERLARGRAALRTRPPRAATLVQPVRLRGAGRRWRPLLRAARARRDRGRGAARAARRPGRSSRSRTACCRPSSARLGAQQPAARRRWARVLVRGASRCCSPTGARVEPLAAGAGAVRVATIGYGLPGSVVAVAVIVPLGLARPPPRRVARHGPAAHRNRDRTASPPTPCASSLSPSRPVESSLERVPRSSTRPRAASAPTASTCSRACTCR